MQPYVDVSAPGWNVPGTGNEFDPAGYESESGTSFSAPYVAGEAAKGVTKVSLDTGVPVMFGVVTTDTVEQAINRSGLKAGNKGYEAAMAAVEVANLYKEMSASENKGKGKAFPHVV